MIHLDLDLIYEVCNATEQHYENQIHCFSLIPLILLDISVKEIQKALK